MDKHRYNYTCCLPKEMNKCPFYEMEGAYCKKEKTTCGMANGIERYSEEVVKKEKWFDKYYHS